MPITAGCVILAGFSLVMVSLPGLVRLLMFGSLMSCFFSLVTLLGRDVLSNQTAPFHRAACPTKTVVYHLENTLSSVSSNRVSALCEVCVFRTLMAASSSTPCPTIATEVPMRGSVLATGVAPRAPWEDASEGWQQQR